jgi:predicted restriction endonuclease
MIVPLTGSDVLKILISSHIVPWSECTDDERLDVDNGILLSPNVDALFDKHLISFSDEGELITSNAISKEELSKLGIPSDNRINVSVGMIKYLKRHREKMES